MVAVMRTNLRRGRGSVAAAATAVPEAGSGVGCEEGSQGIGTDGEWIWGDETRGWLDRWAAGWLAA